MPLVWQDCFNHSRPTPPWQAHPRTVLAPFCPGVARRAKPLCRSILALSENHRQSAILVEAGASAGRFPPGGLLRASLRDMRQLRAPMTVPVAVRLRRPLPCQPPSSLFTVVHRAGLFPKLGCHQNFVSTCMTSILQGCIWSIGILINFGPVAFAESFGYHSGMRCVITRLGGACWRLILQPTSATEWQGLFRCQVFLRPARIRPSNLKLALWACCHGSTPHLLPGWLDHALVPGPPGRPPARIQRQILAVPVGLTCTRGIYLAHLPAQTIVPDQEG